MLNVTNLLVMAILHDSAYQLLLHPPHLPESTTSDFHLFLQTRASSYLWNQTHESFLETLNPTSMNQIISSLRPEQWPFSNVKLVLNSKEIVCSTFDQNSSISSRLILLYYSVSPIFISIGCFCL